MVHGDVSAGLLAFDLNGKSIKKQYKVKGVTGPRAVTQNLFLLALVGWSVPVGSY